MHKDQVYLSKLAVQYLYAFARTCVTVIGNSKFYIQLLVCARGTPESFPKLVGGYIGRPEFLVETFGHSRFQLRFELFTCQAALPGASGDSLLVVSYYNAYF
jgi:hypothetical protein